MEPQKRIGENLARIGDDVAARRRWIEPVSDADREAHAQFMSRGIAFEPADLGDFLRIDPQAARVAAFARACARRDASGWRTTRQCATRLAAKAATRAWPAFTRARTVRFRCPWARRIRKPVSATAT